MHTPGTAHYAISCHVHVDADCLFSASESLGISLWTAVCTMLVPDLCFPLHCACNFALGGVWLHAWPSCTCWIWLHPIMQWLGSGCWVWRFHFTAQSTACLMPLQEVYRDLFCPVLRSAGTTAPRSEEPTAPKSSHGELPICETSIAAGCTHSFLC